MNIMKEDKLKILTGLDKKTVLLLYKLVVDFMADKPGRGFKTKPLTQLIIALTKLRIGLTNRELEVFFNVDHVTISRITCRIIEILSLSNMSQPVKDYLIIDTTSIRLSKEMTTKDYGGHKHHKGKKIQITTDPTGFIHHISKLKSLSTHDFKIFNEEYENLSNELDLKGLTILADKAYVGLSDKNVITPFKKSDLTSKLVPEFTELYNSDFSSMRIKVENVNCVLKSFKILGRATHYKIIFMENTVKALANIINMKQFIFK